MKKEELMKKYEVTPEEIERKRKKIGANIPATTVKLGKLIDGYWSEIRNARSEGKPVVWAVGTGTVLTASQGIPTLLHAAWAPYCTARRVEVPILEAATEFGYLPDTCSYVRCHQGLIHLWDTGQIEKLPESHRIPKPDLVIGSRLCAEHATLAELAARHANCPLFMLDIVPRPSCKTEADWDKAIAYGERQIREELAPLVKKISGKPYDYDKLSQTMANIKRCSMMRDEIVEMMKNKPTPITMFDLGISVGAINTRVNVPEAVIYFEELLAETKQRVANKEGVVPNEKYRFMWDGYSTWSLLGTAMRIMVPRGGVPLVGRYTLGFWPNPETIDIERPVRSYVENRMRYMDFSWPHSGQNFIMKLLESHSIDGIIMPSFTTCRMWNVGQEEWAEIAERKFGIPSLIFQSDMVDRSFNDEGRIRARMEAFFEMIDARRKRWAA